MTPAGAPPQPDLKVNIGGDFTPINPDPGTSVVLGATVSNLGTAASDATVVSFQVFDLAAAATWSWARVPG
ncbi:MAG: hypothetical protein HY680_03620 [Chloroflexi bacterium]|nr:hypothetical protein [Chloroflexota bacterium]